MSTKAYLRAARSPFLVFIAAMVCIGCSPGNDLDRKLAASLISEARDYPAEEHRMIHTVALFSSALSDTAKLQAAVDKFNLSGLVKVTSTPWQNSLAYDVVVEFTEKGATWRRDGSQANKANVVTHLVEFGEITGISFIDENKSFARVEYTELYEPTPFGELLPFGPLSGYLVTPPEPESIEKREAYLRLYDDGWRVERTK